MAFFITNNGNTETLLTDGGHVKVGANLSVENGYLNATGGGGGTGNLDNVKVNNILGTVNNKVAELTLTGADIEITGYEESENVNEELELDASDTVNESFGKLAKALKDDEAAITQAFLSIENATGFNDNLEYVPEESTTILGNAKNLQDADAILMNNLTPLMQFKTQVLDVNKIQFSGGTSALVKIGELALGGTYKVSIPYEGNSTNVTYRFPPAEYTLNLDSYYSISTVISALESFLLPPLIYTGRCITFETAAKTWEWWQYVGPMSLGGTISPADWSNMNNWKQLNISYV